MTVAEIQPSELAKLMQSDASCEIIDVRGPGEFSNVHAEGAKNIPLDQLDPQVVMAGRTESAEDPLYLICQMGGRSRKACERFVDAGFSNVVNVTGGTTLWESQKLPVVRSPNQIMPMDRQVRIAAGLMVVAGALLASFGPTKWLGLGLAGVVGAGLVHSGVTDTCGMAAMLAVMPWNRSKSGSC